MRRGLHQSRLAAAPGDHAGGIDAFVRIYTLAGSVSRSRSYQLGTSAYDASQGVGVDDSGNVIAAGYTFGALPGQTSAGGSDAFLQRIVPP